METPWLAHGQTDITAGGSFDDPMPSDSGVIGEVVALPYTVPACKTLVLEAYGIEAYDAPGIVVIHCWVERPGTFQDPPYAWQYRTTRAMTSCAACRGSNEVTGQRVYVPAGSRLHVRLVNGSQYNPGGTPTGGKFGWYASGRLIDAE
jgi:hypothetical protein